MAHVEVNVTQPVSLEPLTLDDVKDYCRIDFSDAGNDNVIAQVISDARVYGEQLISRSFATQTLQVILEPEAVPEGTLSGPVSTRSYEHLMERPDVPLFGTTYMRLQLPYGPVQSLSLVEYQLTRYDNPEWTVLNPTDNNGNANYRLDTVADPAELSFFSVLAASRYRLTYTTGYTTLPFHLRQAMKALCAFWYDNRAGDDVPDEITKMFRMKKVYSL